MRDSLLFVLVLAAAAALALTWTQSTPAQPPGAPPDNTLSFRIVFGEKQQKAGDYSGTVSLSAGKVLRLAPWRFFREDAIRASSGWKLDIKRAMFENQPNDPTPLTGQGAYQNLVPAGVTVTVEAPPSATVQVQTAQGNFDFPLRNLDHGRLLQFKNGDVLVQRTPTPQRVSEPAQAPPAEEHDYPSVALTRQGTLWVAWQAYKANGDHVYARHSTPAGWSETFRLTEEKADIHQTAVAEDAQGRVWVLWSQRTNQDWHLYARIYDGRQWTPPRRLTSENAPNLYPRLVRDRSGTLHLLWVAYQTGQSHVMWSKLAGAEWSKPLEISGPSAWEPAAATDSKGNLYVAWDSYRTGNYDIFLRRIGPDGSLGPVEQVTRAALFQAHPTLAVDPQDRLWMAWDEAGVNWGKDWNHEDSWRAVTLYADRRPRIAVREGGQWKQPRADIRAAVPRRYNRYVELPRIACDAAGRIWVDLQLRTSTSNNRADYWSNNGRWEHFLTSLEGDRWTPLMPIPESSSRPEGPFRLEPAPHGVWMVWTNDNRPFGPPGGPLAKSAATNEIFAASFASSAAPLAPQLEDFTEPEMRAFPVHANEDSDVTRVRAYRATMGGATYRIVRGDFHRHTEISGDGPGDGSLEDYARYMLDVAQMDTGIIADHNAGSDNEYTWWRTEKMHDILHIKDRFTALFGYERSVNYPNGHRNVVFAQRGVRTLPIKPEEQKGQVNSGAILYPYLRQNRGICMLHSLATGQGSDYRDNDPELEPLVEIYQGYHAGYEYEGAPRAETDNYLVRIHGGYQPAGFWWNALAKGYKLGVQSSSDHISTHCSYALIYTPSTERADIVESMRKRHAFAATDNIIVDYRAVDAQGREHMMGEVIEAAAPPKLVVKIVGTDKITDVDLIKDGKFVFETKPNSNTVEFTYVDNNPGSGQSYYYVRAMQIDRNLAWSSPIWVNYGGKR